MLKGLIKQHIKKEECYVKKGAKVAMYTLKNVAIFSMFNGCETRMLTYSTMQHKLIDMEIKTITQS